MNKLSDAEHEDMASAMVNLYEHLLTQQDWSLINALGSLRRLLAGGDTFTSDELRSGERKGRKWIYFPPTFDFPSRPEWRTSDREALRKLSAEWPVRRLPSARFVRAVARFDAKLEG